MVTAVVPLGERRAALLFFRFLSCEVTAAERPECGGPLVTPVKETASESQGGSVRQDVKNSPGDSFLVID